MTASFQQSIFNFVSTDKRIANRTIKTFQVDVENFDNEVESFTVEAHSAAEAAEIIEKDYVCDIYNMCIYDTGY